MILKNNYQDISLPKEVIEQVTEKRKQVFFFTIVLGVIYIGFTYYIAIDATGAKEHFPIYAGVHKFWLYVFLCVLIILFINREHFLYRAKYYRFILMIMSPLVSVTALFFLLSTIFLIEPSSILVHSIYLSHLALFLFYFSKYLRFWNSVFSGKEGKEYALRIEQYEWKEDVMHPELNAPKENNKKNNYPFYTKAFEKIGNLVVASGFILPAIFAMSATGTGGSVPIMIVELFAFLIAPFAYYGIAKGVAWYLFIRRLEKEKNVIIYNGVWLT